MTVLEYRRIAADFVLDLVDGFALQRGLLGEVPRPFGWVRVLLLSLTPNGEARQVFQPPLELDLVRNTSGHYLFFGRVFRPGYPARRLPLPAGTYELQIKSQFYQPFDLSADLPTALQSPNLPQVELAPNDNYPFLDGTTLLRGSVVRTDGTGVAGATVSLSVAGSGDYQTDGSGQWTLAVPVTLPDPPPKTPPTVLLTVTYKTSGGPDQLAKNVAAVYGKQTSLAATALRGQVLSDGVGVAGASVAVSSFATTVPTQVDGSWAYFFGIDQPDAVVDVTITLPDGRSQTITGVSVVPRTTTPPQTVNFSKP
jgi:hypothetical protein